MPKFSLYKHVRTNGSWRYHRAAFHDEPKDQARHRDRERRRGTSSRGAYYLNHRGAWIDAGADKRSVRLLWKPVVSRNAQMLPLSVRVCAAGVKRP